MRLVWGAPCRGLVSTVKGTGGDIILLEEASYCNPDFFYEACAPLLLIGRTSLIGISTLCSEINFYTRLMRLLDPKTGQPIFKTLSIELVCQKCKDEAKSATCNHMWHLVPRWQSSDKHERLHTIMSDRPDLIVSELSGLAFDSLQSAFKAADVERMFATACPPAVLAEPISIFVDPAAGGSRSRYCVLSVTHYRGVDKVVGIDQLPAECKDPERQFALLMDVIRRLRNNIFYRESPICIYVEFNLGFEAEHHERALRGLYKVRFHRDEKRGRVGVFTTLQVKHAAATLLNCLLREDRVCILPEDELVSLQPVENRRDLRDQLKQYSYQFKTSGTVFSPDRMCLSGKVGGMQDDICVMLNLACYWTTYLRTGARD